MKYVVVTRITGDRLEAIKLLADEKMHGTIDGKEVEGVPVLHLKNGNSILIEQDDVLLVKEE
jgi:hypothetical protein